MMSSNFLTDIEVIGMLQMQLIVTIMECEKSIKILIDWSYDNFNVV